MSAAAESPRPRQKLGELLVEAGLLAPAALEFALEEQKQSGRTLGQILVARGFLPAPTVAAALAEQAGGLVKTEYGYATGLSSVRRNGPAEPPPPPPITDDEPPPTNIVPLELPAAPPAPAPAAAPPPARTDIEDLRARHEALIAAHAQLEAVLGERDRRVTDLEEQLTVLQASHGEAMMALTSARTAVEGERQRFEEMLPELARTTAETVELRRQLADESERRARHEGALAERSRIEDEIARLALVHSERDDRRLEQKIEEQAAVLAAAEARAAQAEAQVETLRAELAAALTVAPPVAEPEPVVEVRHLLFVPGAEGYELFEREGAAPALGSIVDVNNRQLTVVRVTASPLPGDRARCAYLEQIPASVATD